MKIFLNTILNKSKGFTLIELLVVIAIISILSSIALVNLNQARQEARISAAMVTGNSLVKAALDCQSFYSGIGTDGELNCDNAGIEGKCAGPGSQPLSTINICVGHPELGQWPEVPEGWIYGESGPPSERAISTASAGTFRFVICPDAGTGIDCDINLLRLLCTESGCCTANTTGCVL